jgi:hypothetical protein
MRVIGQLEQEVLRLDVINEMESEGIQITIDVGEQLLTVLLPPQLRRDLLVNFALRLKLITADDLIDDYVITSGPGGEVIIKVHFHTARYREIG